MNEFTTEDMSNMLYDVLSEIKDDEVNKTEAVLTTPTTKSKYPCRVINTPLESTTKTENAIPILKRFQITIEHWASKQRECMKMANKTDVELIKKNFNRINTSPIIFDEITKKYRLVVSYEVNYNGITNAFQFIR